MEAALDVFAALVTREAEKGNTEGTTAVYTALMAACEKVRPLPRTTAAYRMLTARCGPRIHKDVSCAAQW